MSRSPKDLPFLVGRSGNRFHITAAGREIVHKPRRFPIEPGSDLAGALIAAARNGAGKVHLSLERAHERACADNAKKAAHVFPGMKLSNMPLRAATDRGDFCTVCRAGVGPGGRRSAPAKCARCYQRERRGQPEAARSTAEPRVESVTFQTTKAGRELLEAEARRLGVTVSKLVVRLVEYGTRALERGDLKAWVVG